MSTTVTTPLGTTTPVLWMELATTRHATSRVLTDPTGQILAVVHGPRPRARESRLVLLYTSETQSRAAEDLHAAGGVCSIADPSRPTAAMSYVVSGDITRTLDPETAKVWIVAIDITEVPA